MRKIRVYCNSGANIHSERSEIIDVGDDWGFSDEEWDALTDEEKYKEVESWAWDRLTIGFDEVE